VLFYSTKLFCKDKEFIHSWLVLSM